VLVSGERRESLGEEKLLKSNGFEENKSPAYIVRLTGVDEILIGDTGVVDVMYGGSQYHCQFFEVREHVLSTTNANL